MSICSKAWPVGRATFTERNTGTWSSTGWQWWQCLPSHLPDKSKLLEGSWGLPPSPELVGVGGATATLPSQHLSLLMASAEFAMKPGADPVGGVWEGARRPLRREGALMPHPDPTAAKLHWLCSNQACSAPWVLAPFLGLPGSRPSPISIGAYGSASASTLGRCAGLLESQSRAEPWAPQPCQLLHVPSLPAASANSSLPIFEVSLPLKQGWVLASPESRELLTVLEATPQSPGAATPRSGQAPAARRAVEP